MKVLLITSPHVKHPAVLQNDFKPNGPIMYGFAPVGLLSLISATRATLGIEPELYDLNRHINEGNFLLSNDFYEQVAEALCNELPDVIGFMTECDSYHHILQICDAVKRQNAKIKIVLGGPHASAVAGFTMKKYACIDAVARGEAEISFPLLLSAFLNNQNNNIPGVIVRNLMSGEVEDGGLPRLVDNLDDLPIPAYELYKPDKGEEIFIEVGRGCPFQCTFCSTAPYWNRRHRVKSPQRILDEIYFVQTLFGTERVHFTHDLFTTNKNWVREVCTALINAGTPSLWTCSARTDTVDKELLSIMRAAGCNSIYFGIESGSPRILEKIKKNIAPEYSINILKSCREQGITPNSGFIVGFPGEDQQSLEDTFRQYTIALEAGCKPTHIFSFCPFADSSLYKDLDNLSCSGHFLDIPLNEELNSRNRQLISGNKELFGSYFKPQYAGLKGIAGVIEGADEFSPLVEAVLFPSLFIAENCGGMFNLYKQWLEWISQQNEAAGKSPYRKYYGSPLDYCRFLKQVTEVTHIPAFIKSLLEVIEIDLMVNNQVKPSVPITIANHRTLNAAELDLTSSFNKELKLGNIVDKLKVDYDISEYLTTIGTYSEEPSSTPLYLLWYVTSENKIQIIKTDELIFRTVEFIEEYPRSVAQLVSMWIDRKWEEQSFQGDVFDAFDKVKRATELGMFYFAEQ